MLAALKYIGYIVPSRKHAYYIFTEAGHADIIEEDVFTTATQIEVDDKMWARGSGWATVLCDCGHTYTERTYPEAVVACPLCGEPFLIPKDAELMRSMLEDDGE